MSVNSIAVNTVKLFPVFALVLGIANIMWWDYIVYSRRLLEQERRERTQRLLQTRRRRHILPENPVERQVPELERSNVERFETGDLSNRWACSNMGCIHNPNGPFPTLAACETDCTRLWGEQEVFTR